MKKEQYNKERCAAIVMAVLLLVCHLKSFAMESAVLLPKMEREDVISEVLPTVIEKEDVVSIILPTVMEEERSPFDFVMDPLGLLYETNAARYGGGVVEEGATLLFQNKEGEYDFSRFSDRLAVTNQSTVPVLLTISAWVTDLGELSMVESDDFTGSDDCSVYLAVVDDQGNVHPISADGEVTIQVKMKAVPENTYVYRLSGDMQSYHLVQSDDFEEIDFDTYYLGLVGACNPNADWSDISVHPVVSVIWRIDPIITEQKEASVDEEDADQNEDESAEQEYSAEKND